MRHPDIPVEAFADFWQTHRSGKAWTGMVKNRCKNGDHYWVETHAAPIIKNRKIVGYTSPDQAGREQIQAASAYRAGKAVNQGGRAGCRRASLHTPRREGSRSRPEWPIVISKPGSRGEIAGLNQL